MFLRHKLINPYYKGMLFLSLIKTHTLYLHFLNVDNLCRNNGSYAFYVRSFTEVAHFFIYVGFAMTVEILKEILNEKTMTFTIGEIMNMLDKELEKTVDEMDTKIIECCLDALEGLGVI